MKIQLIGMRRQSGTSTKTGNDYDMAMLLGLAPIENVSNSKITIKGKGYEVVQIPYDPASEANFMSLDFPAKVDLQTDSIPRYGEFQTIAIGFTKI